jgi:hypothetical protein
MKQLSFLAALLAMVVVATTPALAQVPKESETEQGEGFVGYITDISGDRILVEEDPTISFSDSSPLLPGGDKGYFTVTGETEILQQQGEGLILAAFEDQEVGQLVAATYAGPVLESYPSQGGAGSIAILEKLPGDGDQLLCLLPEGCDTDGDGVPDLLSGEPVPGAPGEEMNTGSEQYNAV